MSMVRLVRIGFGVGVASALGAALLAVPVLLQAQQGTGQGPQRFGFGRLAHGS